MGVWLSQRIEYKLRHRGSTIFTALEQFSAHLRLRVWNSVIVLSSYTGGVVKNYLFDW